MDLWYILEHVVSFSQVETQKVELDRIKDLIMNTENEYIERGKGQKERVRYISYVYNVPIVTIYSSFLFFFVLFFVLKYMCTLVNTICDTDARSR